MCANYTEMKRMLENDPICPMCAADVPAMTVTVSNDSEKEFKALVALMKDSATEDSDKEDGEDEDANKN